MMAILIACVFGAVGLGSIGVIAVTMARLGSRIDGLLMRQDHIAAVGTVRCSVVSSSVDLNKAHPGQRTHRKVPAPQRRTGPLVSVTTADWRAAA